MNPNVPERLYELALAMEKGRYCGFALHDALAEAGCPQWAENHKHCLRDAHWWLGCDVRRTLLGCWAYGNRRTLAEWEVDACGSKAIQFAREQRDLLEAK